MLPPAAALATVLLLAGCVPTDPIITPEPAPDATPIFASDEEALAAATEAYKKYLAVSDAITADGGAGADRVVDYVSAEQLPIELESFKKLEESHRRTDGTTNFDVTSLQKYVDGKDGTASVVVYVCVDVSTVRVVDETGADVTPANRVDRVPLEVEFQVTSNEPREILIARSETWSGNDFCQN